MSENTDYETLKDERDSALNTCSLIAEALGITGAVAGDTIARVQQLVGESAALKAENCIQDFIISAVKDLVRESDGVTGWHRNGDVATWDEVLPELSHSETPATTQALNEIKAQGVDEFVTKIARDLRMAGGGDGYHENLYPEFAEHLECKGGDFAASLRGE
ncbi:hypothetical protein [Yersinia intermedia]|uniref:Uncharacterized protein n=1 Tax=Yersinia intermedia TaxID=631 RepID=A0A0T9LSL9_YERIN|nr:hypothetical protein [Yersinia intermedia]CNF20141.1 Uncharacterised protein [Yersinia intermedia]